MSDLGQSETSARTALRVFMERWSEDNWAAGWVSNVEHYMKRDLRGKERSAFKWLIEQAGGWWGSNSGWPPPFVKGSWRDLKAAPPPWSSAR